MNIEVIFIALGISMDIFAISIALGFSIKKMINNDILKIALFFGAFHAIMISLGWLIGYGFRDFVSSFGYVIAFVILLFIGAKMIYESKELKLKKSIDNKFLFILSIATSIDAFFIGTSLSIINVPMIDTSVFVGLVAFCLSIIGIFIGKKIGHLFENKIEIVGGIILILIAIKLLLENIFYYE